MPVRRIVSLLPAATEIVAALGAWDRLIGVSHECDYPAGVVDLPRVTSSRVRDGTSLGIDQEVRELNAAGSDLFALDVDRLAELTPDLIITQGLCEVCAISEADVRRMADSLPGRPPVLSLNASTLAEVLDSVKRLAQALDIEEEGDELVAGLKYRLNTLHRTLKMARAPRPRVAVIEWTDPLFAAGHWVPEMVAKAGGVDILAKPGEHSRMVSTEEIREAAPELLIFAPCGFGVARATKEAERVLPGATWAWAEGISLWAIDGNALTSRPGPRLCDGCETLARILHPSLFGPPMADRARQLRPAGSSGT